MWVREKKEPQCEFGQYEEIWGGHRGNCKRIIRITADYIVLVDRNKNIDWETTKSYDDSRSLEDKKNVEKTLSQCSIAEHKPTSGLSEASVLSFKTIVGEAIVNCLENNCEGATEILVQADEFRLDRVVEKSREWYLSFTVALTAILISIALILNRGNLALCEDIVRSIDIGSWAIAGACLSIILRSGRLQHASYAGKYLHFIESGCRLVGGFISGQIVYLGVKSGIIFSSLVVEGNSQYIIPLLALLAGASERFAPSIITRIEDSASVTDPVKET
ncbi:hypothetical protein [Cupriavidus necator]|uniref:hypothetical protein n=1 Tax=Cupriavidus necator TaxID=106590 RepID=UPI00339D9810